MPSYDYNDLVQQIARCRQAAAATAATVVMTESDGAAAAAAATTDDTGGVRQEYTSQLQQAVEAFETLSNHCPMTPVLWMQYAATSADFVRAVVTANASSSTISVVDEGGTDTAAAATASAAAAEQTRLSILQLGLQEFPGYALLHLHYLQILISAWSKQQQDKKKGDDDDDDATTTMMVSDQLVEQALQTAIQSVGRGSHRNEGTWIAAIYQLQAEFEFVVAASSSSSTKSSSSSTLAEERIGQVFLNRALVPMKEGNDSLSDEWNDFIRKHNDLSSSADNSTTTQHVLQGMEENRRLEAKFFQPFIDLEDDIDMLMHQGQILARHHLAAAARSSGSSNGEIVNWEPMLQPGGAPSYGMGLGDVSIANAFVKYAQTVHQQHINNTSSNSRHDENDNDNDRERQTKQLLQDRMPDLVLSIYERGVAECPTVESIWLAYLEHLQNEIEKIYNNDDDKKINNNNNKIVGLLPTVARRACRNCPYSVTLVQQALRMELLLANAGCSVLDPDKLVQMAQQALATGFLSDGGARAFVQVYRTVLQIIKRRILFLLASSSTASSSGQAAIEYDQAISSDKKKSKKKSPTSTEASSSSTEELSDAVLEEVSDLCDDLEELYDTVEADLIKKFKQDPQGRVILLQDRALTQAHLLSHVRKIILENNSDESLQPSSSASAVSVPPLVQDEDFFMRRLEKATRVHNPPHPDTYLTWIRYYMTTMSPAPTPNSNGNPTVSSTTSVQDAVVRHLCKVRGLFEKAIHQVGRPKTEDTVSLQPTPSAASSLTSLRDFDTALANLGHEWIEFETTFGSDKSLARATKAIRKKMHKFAIPAAAVAATTTTAPDKLKANAASPIPTSLPSTATASTPDGQNTFTPDKRDGGNEAISLKRSPETDIHGDGETKKRKLQDAQTGNDDNVKQDEMDIVKETEEQPKATNLKKIHNRPKVLVGDREFPAHPFTIRVSNLADETVDMDLVDLLRPKCGAVVHSRIVRERGGGGGGNRHQHHHTVGKSKGWGLVQFEEREAVEKALALTDTLGLHEKLLQIERSHQPAVNLIPPGMHRVKPKGEGRNSKRNEMKRAKAASSAQHEDGADKASQQPQDASHQSSAKGPEKKTKDLGSTSVLGFRPRALGNGKSATASRSKKLKLNLQKGENK